MKRKEERRSELKIKQKRLPNLQHREKYTPKKKKEIEQRPRDMWNNNKRSNFYVIKNPRKRSETRRGWKNIQRNNDEKPAKFGKSIKLQFKK